MREKGELKQESQEGPCQGFVDGGDRGVVGFASSWWQHCAGHTGISESRGSGSSQDSPAEIQLRLGDLRWQ